jgi:hypothetical protein
LGDTQKETMPLAGCASQSAAVPGRTDHLSCIHHLASSIIYAME